MKLSEKYLFLRLFSDLLSNKMIFGLLLSWQIFILHECTLVEGSQGNL